MSVAAEQRFTRQRPCPICGGHPDEPQGVGRRCWGFLSNDGNYAHCMREEHAVALTASADGSYAHRLVGSCKCGQTHGTSPTGHTPSNARSANGKVQRHIVATYDYRDRDGTLVHQTVRFEPKDFRQRRPDGRGDWVWNLDGVSRVLYRLPELVAADPGATVYVVEGEKDADRLRSLGLVATTNAEGAKSWRPEYAEALRGRHVVKLSDLDVDGERHTRAVLASLAGVAASAKAITLPGLTGHGADVSDWLDAGHTRDELEALAANQVAPPAPRTAEVVLTRLSSVKPRKVRWLWQDRIPLGKTTLVVGDPGLGKGFLTIEMAACVTVGRAWPDGSGGPDVGDVIFVSAEDDAADTVLPRFLAAGGDPKRAAMLTAVIEPDGKDPHGEGRTLTFSLEAHLNLLERAIERTSAHLVVIDPISAYLGHTDSHTDAEIRGILGPLEALAQRTGAAIVGILHLNKRAGGPAIYRPGGSIAFIAAARAAHVVTVDPENSTGARRLFLPLKQNLSIAPPGLAYCVQAATIHDDDGNAIPTANVAWEAGTVATTASEALAAAEQGAGDGSVLDEARDFLRDELQGGRVEARQVQSDARKAGITEITLRRARKVLGVEVIRDGFGKDGRWFWCLPPKAEQASEEPKMIIDTIDDHSFDGTQDDHLWPGGSSMVGSPSANGHAAAGANGYTLLPDDWLTSEWREFHDGDVLPNGGLIHADLATGRTFARLDDGTRPGVPLVPCPTCGASALRLGSFTDGGRGRFDCPACGVIWLPVPAATS